jgi:hypothetical protein
LARSIPISHGKSSLPSFLLALILFAPAVFGWFARTQADSIQVVDARVHYQFGQEVQFEATLLSGDPVRQAYLLFQPIGGQTQVGTLNLAADGKVSYRFDLSHQAIRPFSRVFYWFRVTTPADREYTSPSFWFDYTDNRFQWQTLEDPLFRVHWYQGGVDFGQMAQNVARSGWDGIQNLIPLPKPTVLDIYIYANKDDLQSALKLSGQSWVAGHASPDLGVIMVSEEPGPQQNLSLERQIPHELAHILLYRSNQNGYANIPAWLTEGLASLAELYPNPDYQRALDSGKVDGSLLPMETLCGAFPQDTSSAISAYAESASFTRYIENRFGFSGLQSLVEQYQSGVSCGEGARLAFGLPFSQLETDWQQESLGLQAGSTAINRQFIPYLILMGFVVLSPLVAGGYWLRRKKQHDHRTKEDAGS